MQFLRPPRSANECVPDPSLNKHHRFSTHSLASVLKIIPFFATAASIRSFTRSLELIESTLHRIVPDSSINNSIQIIILIECIENKKANEHGTPCRVFAREAFVWPLPGESSVHLSNINNISLHKSTTALSKDESKKWKVTSPYSGYLWGCLERWATCPTIPWWLFNDRLWMKRKIN